MTLDFDFIRESDAIFSGLNRESVRYAVAGGFAVALYGHVRATKDLDILCCHDDQEKAVSVFQAEGYRETAEPWTFSNTKILLRRFMKAASEKEIFHVIDLLIPPQDKEHWIFESEIIPWGEKDQVRVVNKSHLIEMKRLRGSKTDLSDIDNLSKD